MQLRELVLHDYGTYGGRQAVELSSTKSTQPIILVGGMNGAGKTTILDALQLVLYGQRARCASRGSMAYKDYLRQAIHRNASSSDGSSIELSFDHASEGKVHEIRVIRSWHATGSGIRERVEVLRDGMLDPILTEQWDERVDEYAPHRIAHLFFFDGEKIATLAEESGSAEIMRNAIHSLLGLDLVDRLIGDLGILEKRERRRDEVDFDRTRAEQIEAERERLQQEIQAKAEELGTTGNQLDRARLILEQVGEQYRREGGELAEQRLDLERQKGRTIERQQEQRERLRELVHGALPFACVPDLVAGMAEQAKIEQDRGRYEVVAGVLEERDQLVTEYLAQLSLVQENLEAVRGFLEDDRVRRAAGPAEGYLELSSEAQEGLQRLVHGELPGASEAARALAGEIDSLEEERILLLRKLESIPEESLLAELRESRDEALQIVATLEMRERALQEERDRLDGQYEQATELHRRELEGELKAAMTNDKLHRKLHRTRLASETLGEFRQAILRRNMARVEQAILEAFQGLVRKPNLVARLSIDPETYVFKLERPGGAHLGLKQLSAGEKQLLAVSFLWGLARVAGLPLPVVIDTPLGRLDSSHRSNLVKDYFPHASHQVLLLSTDTEIEENRLDELKPFIGRSYLLEYGPEEDRTLVREGYFWN